MSEMKITLFPIIFFRVLFNILLVRVTMKDSSDKLDDDTDKENGEYRQQKPQKHGVLPLSLEDSEDPEGTTVGK